MAEVNANSCCQRQEAHLDTYCQGHSSYLIIITLPPTSFEQVVTMVLSDITLKQELLPLLQTSSFSDAATNGTSTQASLQDYSPTAR